MKRKKRPIPQYPHFDAPISLSDARKLALFPEAVASYGFLPLLSYELSWVPFKNRNSSEPPKSRPIRYAARRDSFIFSRYRRKLDALYEQEVYKCGLQSNVIGYRKVPSDRANRNKSNIQFARDAFNIIRAMGVASILCIDIKGFFDNLDHDRLRTAWCNLLHVNRLPEDHFAVFRAVTGFSYVDRETALRKLGYIGPKIDVNGKTTIGFTVPWKEMPAQLCTPKDYRSLIRPLIVRNLDNHGIPQGIPLSDLLSNLYLLEFDKRVKEILSMLGGHYLRYSDDILIIVPVGVNAKEIRDEVIGELKSTGDRMDVQLKKCSIHQAVEIENGGTSISQVEPPSKRQGIEYLGYLFDGSRISIRPSTLTRLHRRITMSIRNRVRHLRAQYPEKTIDEIRKTLNLGLIHSRYGRRPEDSDASTFFSYAKRSGIEHADFESLSISQLHRLRRFIKRRAERELQNAFK